MTDAELAEDEEMAALRAELEDETAASMRNPRGTLMTSGTTSTSQTRARRQPWPSRYAPPVPTPARTSGAGSSAESSRPDIQQCAPTCTLGRNHPPSTLVMCSSEATRTECSLRISEATAEVGTRQRAAQAFQSLILRQSAGRPKISLLARALRHLCHRIHLHSLCTKRLTRYCSETFLCAWPVSLPRMPQFWIVFAIACLLRSLENSVYLQAILSAALPHLQSADQEHSLGLPAYRSQPSDLPWRKAGHRRSEGAHIHLLMAGHDAADHPPDNPRKSCSGPNSRGYSHRRIGSWMLMLMLLSMLPYQTRATVADARVELPVHRWSSGAVHQTTSDHIGAKPGDSRHLAQPHIPTSSARGTIRKRALRRAIERARVSSDGCTWYRGRRMHLRQLQQGQPPQEPPCKAGLRNEREARTLRIVSWNAGGLHSSRYNELLVWLVQQADTGHPVDLLFVQESHWRKDMEYSVKPAEDKALQYHAVHSAGDEKAGLLCMIRAGIVPTSHIRHQAPLPGRLMHQCT